MIVIVAVREKPVNCFDVRMTKSCNLDFILEEVLWVSYSVWMPTGTENRKVTRNVTENTKI